MLKKKKKKNGANLIACGLGLGSYDRGTRWRSDAGREEDKDFHSTLLEATDTGLGIVSPYDRRECAPVAPPLFQAALASLCGTADPYSRSCRRARRVAPPSTRSAPLQAMSELTNSGAEDTPCVMRQRRSSQAGMRIKGCSFFRLAAASWNQSGRLRF